MVFLIGLVYIIIVFLLPFIYTLIAKPKGSAFVPINNQHNQCGDNTIYGACVNEARLNFFKHRHPCSEEKGGMSVDLFRFNTYRLAAILGLGIKDFRYGYLCSFLLSLIIQYFLLYYIFISFTNSESLASTFSIITLFFNKVIHVANKKNAPRALLSYIIVNIFNIGSDATQDSISDNLRYCITGTSNIFLWTTILLSLHIGEFNEIYQYGSIAIYMGVLFLVYPPTSLLSLVILSVSIIIEIFQFSNYGIGYIFAFLTILIILLSLIKQYRQSIKEILKTDNQVLSESHSVKERKGFLYKLRQMTLNSVTLIGLFILVLNFYSLKSQILLIVTLFIVLFNIVGYAINKNVLFFRFYERGFSDALFLCLIISSYFFISSIFKFHFLEHIIVMSSFLLFLVFLIGQFKMARAQFKGGSYLLDQNEWEVYNFIKNNIPKRKTILTFDYSTLQLIPVYTHANLFVCGAEWLKNPYDEIRKFSYFYVRFIRSKEVLLNKFDEYFKKKKDFTCSPNKKKSSDDLSNYHLVNTLMYVPYVKTFNGKKVYNEEFSAWTGEFIKELNEVIVSDIEPDSPDFVVFRKGKMNNTEVQDNIKILYENTAYAVAKYEDY